MTKDKDLIADCLSRVIQIVRAYGQSQGFEEATIDAIAQQIQTQDASLRREYGGCEPYIPARSPDREAATQKAIDEASRSGRVRETAEKHGISRSTLYRLLKRQRSGGARDGARPKHP